MTTNLYPQAPISRHNRLCAWFLGPNAENSVIMRDSLCNIMHRTEAVRQDIYQNDSDFITPEAQNSPEYQREKERLNKILECLSRGLRKGSVPFWSPRYNAHMASDISMSAVLAYISTMLFNPNNISPEGGPFTSELEVMASQDICHMLGFPKSNESSRPWGRITSGGSVANIEAIWAARNLKFYPLSLFSAMGHSHPLEFIRDTFRVTLCDNERKLLKDCSAWELLNLKAETILDIPYRLEQEYNITADGLTKVMTPFLVQTVGRHVLESQFGIADKPMQFLAGATKHYSLPKACALAGIGSTNLIDIPVDVTARLSIPELDRYLNECLERHQAVYAVIAIMGSTDHGAVDPLAEICDLRKSYQARGMSFVVHADAAWGGYFASLLRSPSDFRPDLLRPTGSGPDNGVDRVAPERHLSDYVTRQFKALSRADSVTVDPHKSGYVPFSAGGLCYRDGRMRYQLTWFNPSGHGSTDPDMNSSVFGMEGSKSGATAAAVWVSSLMFGLHRDGHGMLLAKAKFGALKMYTHLATMDMDSESLCVVPLVMLPMEKANASNEEILAQKQELIRRIRDKPNEDITEEDLEFASNFGSDLSINSFACNFRINGRLNADIAEANYLNQRIYERLSITGVKDDTEKRPLIIMLTKVNQKAYVGDEDLKILVNCVMSPFLATFDFTRTIATEFRRVAEDVIRGYSLHRNTPTPTRFYFIMQGTDQVHLVLLPSFHVENHRRQVILSCELSSGNLHKYRAIRTREPKRPVVLYNKNDMTLDEMLQGGLEADIVMGLPQHRDEFESPLLSNVAVTDLKVIKNRRLNSRFLDSVPPRSSIFHLYGTLEQMHIDHALLVGQNVQLTSDQISLELVGRKAISREELSGGLIAVFRDMHEQTFLPIVPPQIPPSFRSGQSHRVLIYRDLANSDATGPNLFGEVMSAEPIASGNLRLGNMTIADSTLMNLDPWRICNEDQIGGLKQRPYYLETADHGLYMKCTEMWAAGWNGASLRVGWRPSTLTRSRLKDMA